MAIIQEEMVKTMLLLIRLMIIRLVSMIIIHEEMVTMMLILIRLMIIRLVSMIYSPWINGPSHRDNLFPILHQGNPSDEF